METIGAKRLYTSSRNHEYQERRQLEPELIIAKSLHVDSRMSNVHPHENGRKLGAESTG